MKIDDRIKEADKVVKSGKKYVLYIIEDINSAQFRYRCDNVMRALNKSEDWRAIYFLKSDITEIKKYVEGAEFVVIERQTDKDGVVGEFVDYVHGLGKKVVFDLDDLIFDYRDLATLMISTGSKNIAYWVGYVWGIRRIAKKADAFFVTNGFLGKKVQRSFGKDYKVIPNSLNDEQVEQSVKDIKNKEHDGFVIGYFSGSPTHRRDFEMIEDDLMRFLNKYDNAKLLIVGQMKLSERVRRAVTRVEILPMMDYLEMQERMAKVDVNIAPLLENDFTNCKSELKYFEAAVVKTITLASPTYSYRNAISSGKNGLIVEQGEWYDELKYLYNHPNEIPEIADAAREYALENYYGEKFLEAVESAYAEIAE